MQANTGMWFNRHTTDAGDYFKVVKVYKGYEHEGVINPKRYLIRFTTGKSAGVEVVTHNLPIRKKPEFNPLQFFQVCLSGYVNAGWGEDEINRAYLCPEEYKPYLAQWLRNREALETI